MVLIEHNLDVLASADHIIDLGPEGGLEGGNIVSEGAPAEIVEKDHGHTAVHLRGFLDQLKGRVSHGSAS